MTLFFHTVTRETQFVGFQIPRFDQAVRVNEKWSVFSEFIDTNTHIYICENITHTLVFVSYLKYFCRDCFSLCENQTWGKTGHEIFVQMETALQSSCQKNGSSPTHFKDAASQ